MATYHGRGGVVYLSTSGSGTASSVLNITEWSIDRDTDVVEVTSFGDSNKTYVQGLANLQGSFSGFWNDTETKIFTAASSTDAIKLYLYPSSSITTKYAYGTAWLSASISTSVSGAVAISGNFSAATSWGFNL